MNLYKYITTNYATQVEFAAAQNVNPQQVSQWIRNGFIVINGAIYSPRRKLAPPPKPESA